MDKRSVLGGVALVLAVAAVAVSLRVGEQRTPPADRGADRGAVLERLASIERRLDLVRAGAAAASEPVDSSNVQARLLALETALLELRLERDGEGDGGGNGGSESTSRVEGARGGAAFTVESADPAAVNAEVLAAVDARIDKAVEKKAAELQKKGNKKPSLDTVAELLELDAHQRAVVEHEVREGQRQIRELLEMPTADGTRLVDELVEVMAYGHAKSPEAGPRFMKWIGRVMSETVPGTDQTYAARAEAVKASVRDSFRRTLSKEQYAEFEEWGFDPTEVQDIPDSPWADLEARAVEHAAKLESGQ